MTPKLIAFDVNVFACGNVDILEKSVSTTSSIRLVSPPRTDVIHTDG